MKMLKIPPGRDLRLPFAFTGLIEPKWFVFDWPSYWLNRWCTAQAWMRTRGVKRLLIHRYPRMHRVGWDSPIEQVFDNQGIP